MEWSIVPGKESDRSQGVDWTNEINWFHVKSDFQVWEQSIDSSCFLAAKTKDGELLGFCIGAKHPNTSIGFIGEYCVRKDMRGKGIGKSLFDAALKSFSDCSNAALSARKDGTMWPVYQEVLGFSVLAPWRTLKMRITKLNPNNFQIENAADFKIVGPDEMKTDQLLLDYDKSICGINREKWLKLWIRHPAGFGKICLDKNGSVCGFGVIRPESDTRLRIGPLYSDHGAAVRLLIKSLLQHYAPLDGKCLELRVPNTNADGMKMVYELSPVEPEAGENFPMFTKEVVPDPAIVSSRVYSISDVEINFI